MPDTSPSSRDAANGRVHGGPPSWNARRHLCASGLALLLLSPLASMARDGARPAARAANEDAVHQLAVAAGFMAGVHEGPTRFGELLRLGDFGTGALSPTDGEVIILDGVVWHADVKGRLRRLPEDARTPFTTLKRFVPDRQLTLPAVSDFGAFARELDARLGSRNHFHAVRIDGRFQHLKLRSVPRQRPPYPSMQALLAQQHVFDANDVTGTLVGFRFPTYVAGVIMPGWHFHFVDADRKLGGHVLDVRASPLTAQLDSSRTLSLLLPDDPLFNAAPIDEAQSAPAAAGPGEPDFLRDLDAATLAVISDGDFVGHSYASGRLADSADGHRDLLTLVRLGEGGASRSHVEVSNSVTSAPEALALTPDGGTAFVIERLGQRPHGAQQVRELPPGARLSAVDLRGAPRVAATTQMRAFPEALAVHPEGRWVAVLSNDEEAAWLQLVAYGPKGFGAVSRWPLHTLGVRGEKAKARHGITATNVQWHPSGRYLAVNVNTLDRVVFLELTAGTNAVPQVRPWGEPVRVGKDPFVGRFTPDGRHYLTSNWGRDFSATTLEGRIPTTPSSLSVIRLAPVGTAGKAARHQRIGEDVLTGLSAEGLAISPDGLRVATVNMRGTAFPRNSPRFHRDASVTLLAFSPGDGRLRKLGDYPFEGVLPEGGTFDKSGRHFLVSVFQQQEGQPPGGGIEIFRVTSGDDEAPALRHLGRLPVPHGAHHVEVR
ncbi:acetolactate decarboxylase [Myxococcus sp. Y35]|uniref:acetolactate decarboxylase n=1 Tax=Pseudomyxococcus flavus TaxID=3115648 RepID=UPI003CF47266